MTWSNLSGLLVENSLKYRIPLIGEFELTARCNLKCKMCYVCKNSKDKEAILYEKSAKEWIKLANEAKDAGMLFLLLTGGEVFLRQDFKTIYEEISMMGFSTSIYTNATLITPQIASWIGRIAPSQIDVSLYGASPESYRKICGDASGYDKAIRGIRLLKDQGINVQLRTTIIRDNMEDYEKLEELAQSFQCELGIVNYISPRREGGNTSPKEERLSPLELARFEDRVNKYYMNKEMERLISLKEDNLEVVEESPPQSVIELEPTNQDPLPCNSGKNTFWITWDGRMIPCSLMSTPETHPFQQGFQSAWDELKMKCNTIPICKACNTCSLQEYCLTCPARLLTESGDFEKPGAYLCQLAKAQQMIVENENQIMEVI